MQLMSSPCFHGSSSVNLGDHTAGAVGKSRVTLIEGLALNRTVSSKLSLGVRAALRYWKKGSPRSLAPLEMQSFEGKLLMGMIDQRQPPEMISRVASQQLERLAAAAAAAAASAASSQCTGRFNAHEGTLDRSRIADVEERERSRSLQDIMYALVACRMLVAMPHQLTTSTHSTPGHHGHTMEGAPMTVPFLPHHHPHVHRDDRLQSVHSPDVRPLIVQHVSMVINGKHHPNLPYEPQAFARVCRFELGKMYAASVMYGYFLTRVHQRFKLDGGLQLEAGSTRLATMEAYMESGFDAETLRRTGRMRCAHSVDVIERHVEALFGKAPPRSHARATTKKSTHHNHVYSAGFCEEPHPRSVGLRCALVGRGVHFHPAFLSSLP